MTRPKAERQMNRQLEEFVGIVRPKAETYAHHNERCHAKLNGERCNVFKGHEDQSGWHATRYRMWKIVDGEIIVREFRKRR